MPAGNCSAPNCSDKTHFFSISCDRCPDRWCWGRGAHDLGCPLCTAREGDVCTKTCELLFTRHRRNRRNNSKQIQYYANLTLLERFFCSTFGSCIPVHPEQVTSCTRPRPDEMQKRADRPALAHDSKFVAQNRINHLMYPYLSNSCCNSSFVDSMSVFITKAIS